MHGTRMTSSSETSRGLSPKMLKRDYEGHNLLFVVGCPRSGTTWVQRLLASHPQVRTGQESNLFMHYVGDQLRNWRGEAEEVRGGMGLSCYFTEAEFLLILKTYLVTLLHPMVGNLAPGELFLEKSPSHGRYLPEILELLPQARVIHVLRDGRDVISSLLASDEWLSSWAPRDAVQAAGWWTGNVKTIRDSLAKWPRNQFHEIRYESLSRTPVEVLRGCADFLGLEWDPRDIASAVDANHASKARANGGGTPIPLSGEVAKRSGPTVVEPKGFIRKAVPGGWKDDLNLFEKFRVWRAAHKLMDELGYHWPKAMALAFASLSACVDLAKMPLSGRNKGK
jgi:hypothetical protein